MVNEKCYLLYQLTKDVAAIKPLMPPQLVNPEGTQFSSVCRMDWLDLLAVQGTLKSLLQHHSSKASILRRSAAGDQPQVWLLPLPRPLLALKKDHVLVSGAVVGEGRGLWGRDSGPSCCSRVLPSSLDQWHMGPPARDLPDPRGQSQDRKSVV